MTTMKYLVDKYPGGYDEWEKENAELLEAAKDESENQACQANGTESPMEMQSMKDELYRHQLKTDMQLAPQL